MRDKDEYGRLLLRQSDFNAHDQWRWHKKGGIRLKISDNIVLLRGWADNRNISGAEFVRCHIHGRFENTVMKNTIFSSCDMSGIGFDKCELTGAKFYNTTLIGTSFQLCDLANADFRNSYMFRTDFESASNVPDKLYSATTILPEGNIIGYKKLRDYVMARLLIPEGAKRTNGTGRKCRAEYAEVLELWNPYDGKHVDVGYAKHDKDFAYHVGDIVRPTQPYDTNIWKECSYGIHFFITMQEALDY